MSQGNAAQTKLNAELGIKLDESIGHAQFMKLRNFLKGAHGIKSVRSIEETEYVCDLIDLLIRDGKIKVGEPNGYQLLIEGLDLINEKNLADVVKKYQADIAKAGNPEPAGSEASGTASQPASLGGSTKMTQQGNTVSGHNIANLQIHSKGDVNIGLPPK